MAINQVINYVFTWVSLV